MAELNFEYEGKRYIGNISFSGNDALLKLVHESNGTPVAPGSDLVEKLHTCFERLMSDNDDMQLGAIQRAMSGSTAQIKVTIDPTSDAWPGREMVLWNYLNAATQSGMDVGKLEPWRSAKKTPSSSQPSKFIDPAKLDRASAAAYRGFEDIMPKGQSFTRYAAFLYNMSQSPNVDLRQEATKFLADNKYNSTDHATNQAITASMVAVAQEFIAAEQKLVVER
jgi:hypothetical protein